MTGLPDEVDVDGRVDAKGVRFVGKAKRQPDGTWCALADVDGALCLVECTVVFLHLDQDLDGMDRDALIAEVKKLRAGVRQHRDAEGHNLCWWVPELWSLLPEAPHRLPQVPPWPEFVQKCAAYRASLDDCKSPKR